MNKATVLHLLENSGFKVLGMDDDFVYFEDPSCILSAFDTVLHYAWIVILVLVAFMLLGWAFLYMKNGTKITNVFNNFKSLLLVLSVLAVVKPVVNFIWNGSLSSRGDLFARGCEQKRASLTEIEKLLEMREQTFAQSDEALMFESFNIVDSGPVINSTSTGNVNGTQNNLANQNSTQKSQSENYLATYAMNHGAHVYENGQIVFQNEQTGIRTFQKLLQSKKHANKTIKDLSDYPVAKEIADISNVPLSKQISTFNNQEQYDVATAIVKVLGGQTQHFQKNKSEKNTRYAPSADAYFVRVEGRSDAVIYVSKDGEKTVRIGGSRAWRNNNPGAIRTTTQFGAIGSSGGFAVFPDEETGMRAIILLLRSDKYRNLSIKDAIHKWAPAADNNNPASYAKHVSELTGLAPERKIKSLDDKEITRVAKAIRKIEGWKQGQTQKI